MPIYDYLCGECGKTYDVFHKSKEIEEDIVCPSCGSKEHRRLMSAPAIAMSGGSEPSPRCDGPSCGCGGCGLD